MRVAVWQGFDPYWENDPHRLNQFGSAISTNGGERGEHGDVAFHSHMSIGRFPPDRCHTYTIVDEVGTPSTGFVDGRCSVRLCGRVGERAEAQGEAGYGAPPRRRARGPARPRDEGGRGGTIAAGDHRLPSAI